MRHLSTFAVCALLLVGAGCSPASTTTEPVAIIPTTTTDTETKPSHCVAASSPNIPIGDVLALAKEKRASSFDAIASDGASVISLDEGRTYGVWWTPDGFDPSTDMVIVSLHGHGEYAAKGFEVWYPTIKKNDVAYLGIQWWFGRSLEDDGYYDTRKIAALVDEALRTTGVTSPNVVLHGFSMGSARSYGVTALETLCGDARIALTISESGEWKDGYPLYADMLSGIYGEQPLSGNPFILFCGGAESGPMARGTCDGMSRTRSRIEQLGGVVTDLLTDPNGGHGSLTMNPANADAAIAAARRNLE